MNEIKTGIEFTISSTVTPDKLATSYCSGTLEVFATPAMIALMEQTAMESVAGLLAEGKTTVGTRVNVEHLRATAIGKKVYCKSVLVSANNNELEFEVTAFDEKGIIGKGTHTRFIIDTSRFVSKLLGDQ